MTNGGRNKCARLATLASQIVNVLWFDGNEDETVSGRAYREGVLNNNPEWLARRDRIDAQWFKWFGEPNHCEKSHMIDRRNTELFLPYL